MQLAERAADRFGTWRVEPVTFSSGVKEALAYPVKAAFEDKNIRIPFDRNLRADLRAIRKETTAAGNIRFSADRGENGHSDRFWALALALHAVGSDTSGPCLAEPSAPDSLTVARSRSFMYPRRQINDSQNKWPV
jgi:phage FluMu gp28-like protein